MAYRLFGHPLRVSRESALLAVTAYVGVLARERAIILGKDDFRPLAAMPEPALDKGQPRNQPGDDQT